VPVTYESAVHNLLELGHELASNRKFDLAHMRRLAAALGNPQRKLQSVLIAGTNGKGSTAATLASIVQAAGYRTGLYTSPHLLRVNERIQINQEPISDAEFAVIYDRVERCAHELVERGELPWHPSFFEMLTAMAFEYFASAGVEMAVLEVGLGGRLDATNIVDPFISVITDIDFDHQNFLGNTLPEIAHEKAGILRSKGAVVLLPQHPAHRAAHAWLMHRPSAAVAYWAWPVQLGVLRLLSQPRVMGTAFMFYSNSNQWAEGLEGWHGVDQLGDARPRLSRHREVLTQFEVSRGRELGEDLIR